MWVTISETNIILQKKNKIKTVQYLSEASDFHTKKTTTGLEFFFFDEHNH